jgi:hypothetical protein
VLPGLLPQQSSLVDLGEKGFEGKEDLCTLGMSCTLAASAMHSVCTCIITHQNQVGSTTSSSRWDVVSHINRRHLSRR